MTVTELPGDVRTWIEEAGGGRLVAAGRQAGGGRKEAWLVDVERPDGVLTLFLRWDRSDPDELWDPWTVRREADVYRALTGRGLPAAEFVSLHPTRQAMLLSRVSGQASFAAIQNPGERVALAQEFMGHLAALHALDLGDLGWPGAGEPVSVHTRRRLDELEAVIQRRGGTADPLLRLTLDWLAANVPGYEGPAVLVQGDTGPGNFLHEQGKLTAIVDWELAHPGDPMDDLAWVSLRSVQDPFPGLATRFDEYARLSGNPLDGGRIRYYRLMAEATILTMNHGPGGQPAARGGDQGARLIFGQLHRRLCVEVLAEALDLGPEGAPEAVPGPAVAGLVGPGGDPQRGLQDEPGGRDRALFDWVLDELRHVVVPALTDSFAAQRTKGMARALKYLAARSASGPAVDAAELDDLSGLLGHRPASIGAGRVAVSELISAGQLQADRVLPVLRRSILRDNEVLRTASGALAERHYEGVA